MIKDIPVNKVEDVAVCIVPRKNEVEDEVELWDVYLVNLKPNIIRTILINAKSYGEMNGKSVETATARYFVEKLEGETAVRIEPIETSLFEITTEYWLSFSYNDFLFDKKYIFVKGSIVEENFTMIPYIEERGVMIK